MAEEGYCDNNCRLLAIYLIITALAIMVNLTTLIPTVVVTLRSVYIYIYIYIYVCVCVCVHVSCKHLAVCIKPCGEYLSLDMFVLKESMIALTTMIIMAMLSNILIY